MWYASLMEEHPIEAHLKEAWAATRHAVYVREYHARRTEKGSSQREDDISEALERLAKAMRPIRSFIQAAPFKQNKSYSFMEKVERAYDASWEIQRQRRKLWKMKKR